MKDKILGQEKNSLLMDALKTEFQATVLLAKAPFIALREWSTEPLHKAIKESEQLSREFTERHTQPNP